MINIFLFIKKKCYFISRFFEIWYDFIVFFAKSSTMRETRQMCIQKLMKLRDAARSGPSFFSGWHTCCANKMYSFLGITRGSATFISSNMCETNTSLCLIQTPKHRVTSYDNIEYSLNVVRCCKNGHSSSVAISSSGQKTQKTHFPQ